MNLDFEERHNVLVDIAEDNESEIEVSDADIIRILAFEILSLKRQIEWLKLHVDMPE